MTKFDPEALLVARSRTADEGAIIRMSQRARELRAKGADVVSMTLGEPDFDTPGNIQENGAKQAIANAVLSIIEPGDEVIMLAPFWVSYEITVRFAGGTPVVLHAGVEENYKVPVSRIAAAITPRTKLIVLNSPSNPSGAVWTKAELRTRSTNTSSSAARWFPSARCPACGSAPSR